MNVNLKQKSIESIVKQETNIDKSQETQIELGTGNVYFQLIEMIFLFLHKSK